MRREYDAAVLLMLVEPPLYIMGVLRPKKRDDFAFSLAAFSIEHPRAQQRVSVIGDESAVGSFDHGDAGIMRGRNDAYRRTGEQLPHDRRMTQGVKRDLAGILADCFGDPAKWFLLIGMRPRLAARPRKQWRGSGAPGNGYFQPDRKPGADWHWPMRDRLRSTALARYRRSERRGPSVDSTLRVIRPPLPLKARVTHAPPVLFRR